MRAPLTNLTRFHLCENTGGVAIVTAPAAQKTKTKKQPSERSTTSRDLKRVFMGRNWPQRVTGLEREATGPHLEAGPQAEFTTGTRESYK